MKNSKNSNLEDFLTSLVMFPYTMLLDAYNILTKGLFFGTSFGAAINAMVSGLTNKRIKPKDANSNLSYMLSNALFGLTTAFVASKMGHDSIYDTPPMNNWIDPTEKTTEESRHYPNVENKVNAPYFRMEQLP